MWGGFTPLAELSWLTTFLPFTRRRVFGIAVHASAVVDALVLAWRVFKHERLQLDFSFDELFNVGHQTLVTAGHKTHRQARRTGAAGASNPVHIILGIERHVKVEHRRHVLDVQPSGGHVGTHQQVHFATFEGFECLEALVLAFVAVQGGGFQAFFFKRASEAGAAQLAVDKHKGLLHASRF